MGNPFGEQLQNRQYFLDANGRLIPAPARYPSAAGSAGFKPLAEWVHAQGLKFGLHIVRGIPKRAVQSNLPIAGSSFHATQAAERRSLHPPKAASPDDSLSRSARGRWPDEPQGGEHVGHPLGAQQRHEAADMILVIVGDEDRMDLRQRDMGGCQLHQTAVTTVNQMHRFPHDQSVRLRRPLQPNQCAGARVAYQKQVLWVPGRSRSWP